MKTIEQKINNIIGQLNGINKMIENEDDCLPILIQLKAVKSALSAVSYDLMEDNLDDCLKKTCGRDDKTYLKQIFRELTK